MDPILALLGSLGPWGIPAGVALTLIFNYLRARKAGAAAGPILAALSAVLPQLLAAHAAAGATPPPTPAAPPSVVPPPAAPAIDPVEAAAARVLAALIPAPKG